MSKKSCIRCGVEIEGGPKNRRTYCTECSKQRRKETNRVWYEKVVGTDLRKQCREPKKENARTYTTLCETDFLFEPVTDLKWMKPIVADNEIARRNKLSYGQQNAPKVTVTVR